MTEPTLYGNARSTFTRTARMICIEKGVDYALAPAELASDAYRELHPFGHMPAMRHGDLVIYETAAIGLYVDGAFDGPPLMPAALDRRARAVQWISAINDYFVDAIIRRYILQYVFVRTPDGQPDREAIDAALPDVRQRLAVLDDALADGPWLAGPAPTLPDLFAAPILFYLAKMPEGGELLGAVPNVGRAIAAMEQRPSFTETLPPMPG